MKAKHSALMIELFREAFCWLPLAHVLNKKVLVVHGGLFSKDSVSLDEIRQIDRNRYVLFSVALPFPSTFILLTILDILHASCPLHILLLKSHTHFAVIAFHSISEIIKRIELSTCILMQGAS